MCNVSPPGRRIPGGAAQLSALVDRLVGIYEAGMAKPWPGNLPADFKAERVTIEIRSAQKSTPPYRQTFVWNPDAT